MEMEDDKNMNQCLYCSINDKDNYNVNGLSQKELLKKIKCLKFAIVDLALFLDTHPNDRKALCLHNKYCKDLKNLEDMYQKIYGPLTINYPCNKWRWLEEPWPWEGGRN